jgi:hypothetical protein
LAEGLAAGLGVGTGVGFAASAATKRSIKDMSGAAAALATGVPSPPVAEAAIVTASKTEVRAIDFCVLKIRMGIPLEHFYLICSPF